MDIFLKSLELHLPSLVEATKNIMINTGITAQAAASILGVSEEVINAITAKDLGKITFADLLDVLSGIHNLSSQDDKNTQDLG